MTTRKMLTAVDLSEISEPLVIYSHSIAHQIEHRGNVYTRAPPYGHLAADIALDPSRNGCPGVGSSEEEDGYYVRKAEESFPNEPEHKHEIIVKEGYPADVVIQTAKEGNYGLIVVGYKGHSTLVRILVGSTGAASLAMPLAPYSYIAPVRDYLRSSDDQLTAARLLLCPRSCRAAAGRREKLHICAAFLAS